MFKNVLVGVDGRQAGRDAIALAAQLADPDAKLTLAHIYVDAASPMHAVTPAFIPTEREISQAMLERERAATGVRADLVSIRSMSPSAGLHQQAAKQGADLIVVGSCERGTLGQAVQGNDAQAVMNGAPCPVAIASGGYATTSEATVEGAPQLDTTTMSPS